MTKGYYVGDTDSRDCRRVPLALAYNLNSFKLNVKLKVEKMFSESCESYIKRFGAIANTSNSSKLTLSTTIYQIDKASSSSKDFPPA